MRSRPLTILVALLHLLQLLHIPVHLGMEAQLGDIVWGHVEQRRKITVFSLLPHSDVVVCCLSYIQWEHTDGLVLNLLCPQEHQDPFQWGCSLNSRFPAYLDAWDYSTPDAYLCFSLNSLNHVLYFLLFSHYTLAREVEVQQSLKPLALCLWLAKKIK